MQHDHVLKTVIFLPARPASQTHDSHKGRMILNHVGYWMLRMRESDKSWKTKKTTRNYFIAFSLELDF